jgi:hypothetical protein
MLSSDVRYPQYKNEVQKAKTNKIIVPQKREERRQRFGKEHKFLPKKKKVRKVSI